MTSKTRQDFKIFDPPMVNDDDDPRQIAYVPVSIVHVDPQVQRETTETRLDEMGEVDWALMEGLTLTVRDDGTVVATEGQHRALLLQREKPESHVWALLNPGQNNEAAIALAIATGRKNFTPLQRWTNKLRQGQLLQVRGEEVLIRLGLRLYVGAGVSDDTAIGAVGAVEKVMRGFPARDDDETIERGAVVLEQTLQALKVSFPGQAARFDGAMIGAVGRLISRNENIRLLRLTQVLHPTSQSGEQLMPATRWLQKGTDRLPSQSKAAAIGKAILDGYNKGLGEKNQIRW